MVAKNTLRKGSSRAVWAAIGTAVGLPAIMGLALVGANAAQGGGNSNPSATQVPPDTGRIVYINTTRMILDLDAGAISTIGGGVFPGLIWTEWTHTGDTRWILFDFDIAGVDDLGALSEDDSGNNETFHTVLAGDAFGFDGVQNPAVSPDDRWIVYVARDAATRIRDLYVQAFDGVMALVSGDPVNITMGAVSSISQPSWSPDGRSLAFNADQPGDGSSRPDIFRSDLDFDGPRRAARV